MDKKLESERNFHNRQFSGEEKTRAKLHKYYRINSLLDDHFYNTILEVCKGTDLLDYGCGTGESAFLWAENGAKVTGIDISDEGIRKAKEMATKKDYDISFYKMDAERMHHIDANTFDIVAGISILHHLDLDKAYKELSRVLRKNGRAMFIEPLGHNFFINLYRKLTPSLRTEDEHPLMMGDIEVAKKYFGEVRVNYYNIFTILAVPFREKNFFNHLLLTLDFIDRVLMATFPFIKRYAWSVVIELQKPFVQADEKVSKNQHSPEMTDKQPTANVFMRDDG